MSEEFETSPPRIHATLAVENLQRALAAAREALTPWHPGEDEQGLRLPAVERAAGHARVALTLLEAAKPAEQGRALRAERERLRPRGAKP